MAKSPTAAADQDKFILRLPDGMRDQLKASAEQHGRSMNAEVVALLEDAILLQAQVEALMLERNMLADDRRKVSADLRELRRLKGDMDQSEEAARRYYLKKYEGAFRMIANMYAAGTYNRNHRGQLHDLLEEAGISPDFDGLRKVFDPE